MRTISPTVWTAGLLVLLAPLPAPATDGTREDIPVTDPVLLERMGLEADATNIFATPQALEDLLRAPNEQAAEPDALQGANRSAAPEPGVSGAFGTDTEGYTSLGAYAFRPHRSRVEYAASTTAYRDIACAELGSPADTPRFIAELVALPHGARLRRVTFWVHDALILESVTVRVWRHCMPDGEAGDYTSTLLGQRTTGHELGKHRLQVPQPGIPGFFDEDIDNQSCVYSLWVDLGQDGFCPGEPLTRGQMAAFLAKALGLHWGEISQ